MPDDPLLTEARTERVKRFRPRMPRVELITTRIRRIEREADRVEWDEGDLDRASEMRDHLRDLRHRRDEGEHYYPNF